MSERNTSGNDGAVSGTTAKKYQGYRPREKRVSGDTPELEDNVFVFAKKDQTDVYLKTVEAIANYAQIKFDKDIKILVRDGKEKTFKEPKEPTGRKNEEPSRAQMEKYKSELADFHKTQREYKLNKQQMYQIILGQCSEPIKNKLRNDSEVTKLEQDDDVAGLLTKIKAMIFSMEDVQHPFWTAQIGLRRFTALFQGPGESPDSYYKRYLLIVKVLEEQWGEMYPDKLCTDDTADAARVARDKFMAAHFLGGANRQRYGKLLDELNNSYLAKKDNYPATLEAAYKLLCHFQDHKLNGKDGYNNSSESSGVNLAQVKYKKKLEKMRCFKCNELGHLSRNCPTNHQNNNQVEESKATDDNQGSRQRITPWRRPGAG